MDIPQLSSVALAGIAGTTAIAPLSAPATDDSIIVAPAPPSLTTVDLSPLGRFLSATSLFQKKLVALQAASTSVPDSGTTTSGEVAAATTAFAVAFNEFQAGSLGATDAGTGGGESLAGLFARQFGAETSAAGSDPDSALASLASIGVRFNADPTADPDARLTVDLPVLQVALEVDPATTTALLERAGAAFGALVQAEVQPAGLSAGAQAAVPTALPDQTAPAPPATPDARAPATSAALAAANDQAAPTLADNALNATGSAADLPAARSTATTQAQDAFTQARAAAPNTSADVQQLVNTGTGAASPGVPVPQAIPATPPATAAPAGTLDADADAEVARQSAQTPVTRPAAQKELAERAVELAESKRSQSAYEQERAQLAERIEVLDRQRLEQQQVDARAAQLERQRDDGAARGIAAAETQPASTVTLRAVPAHTVQPETTVAEQARPLTAPLASAQPSARDPAVAAAIAAYSLNTGPFAALNARQELAAQRVKTVPAVSGVARVAPVETQTAPKGGTRQ